MIRRNLLGLIAGNWRRHYWACQCCTSDGNGHWTLCPVAMRHLNAANAHRADLTGETVAAITPNNWIDFAFAKITQPR